MILKITRSILPLGLLFLMSAVSFADAPNGSEPGAPSMPSIKSCKTAKDCKGMVPHHCVACTNGKEGGCAHWSCVQSKCEIKTCDMESEKH
jgi:hypothetical protein